MLYSMYGCWLRPLGCILLLGCLVVALFCDAAGVQICFCFGLTVQAWMVMFLPSSFFL
ncbi:hypothetical protein Acr_27g0009370 [Actinidia rufa]|uniref:Uncharacterized protein n=1 Tax=Actinidia rufa TaxID=165716 RepID=A0A7J0H844_9ERIC|nr:hypothetical protein Acr_27g0009370 [Actinidia rufa]